MTPFRDDLWNLPEWMYLLHWLVVILCGALVVYGLWRRIRLWRMGRPAQRLDHPGRRFGSLLLYGLGQRRILDQAYPGLMHGLIFYGFVIFFIATSLVGIQMDLNLPILRGNFYLWYELVLNGFTILFVIGLVLAAYRRYRLRPDRLNPNPTDGYVLGSLAFIAVSGLTLEVMRLRSQQPPWAEWSWLGNALAGVFGPPPANPPAVYPYVWWMHQIATFGLVASLPYTKFLHIVTSPTNVFFRDLGHPGVIDKIENLDTTEEPLGVGAIPHFTWKQLLDADACTECGRCQAACPAYAAHQPLSPKQVVLDYRDRMSEYPGALWKWQELWVAHAPFLRRIALGPGEPAERELVGDVIADETLWSCTTCRACERDCPVFIQPMHEIVAMRRHLALEEGRLPDTLAAALRNTERQGNPWGQARHQRDAWASGLDVPVMADVGQADVLYWVGCAGSYDPSNQKVSQAMVKIFRAAGVNFAILGEEETCNAEWARRAGEEYLYQTQAEQNVETLKQYRFQRIVTQCPHCYNTLKNEYPQFGGQWDVVHHSQYIAELIAAGRLALRPEPERSLRPEAERALPGRAGPVVYHDSCYLGRYNQVYNPPRQVLDAVPGLARVEPPNHGENGFCCGGGGACMWMEHEPGQRVNEVRMDQLQSAGPALAAVACPFCLIMLNEAAGARDQAVAPAVMDIAQVVAAALG